MRIRTAARLVAASGVAASALLATMGSAASAPTTSATAGTMPVPVDRQDYVTAYTTTNPTDGSTVDPYDADPSSIHVGISGGKEFARSFVHLAIDYIPQGAVATDAVMTLHLPAQSDASNTGAYPIYNVNNASALVQACVLVTTLPATFDNSHPPAYDCQHGSAAGVQSKDNQTWTFDLKDLVAYWNQHGNTGAALVPIGSGDPSESWQVAFYKSRSASVVTYTVPAAVPSTGPTSSTPPVVPTTVPTTTGSQPTTVGSVPGGSFTPPAAGTSSAPAAAVPPAIAPSSTPYASAGENGGTSAGTGTTNGPALIWPWVLLGSVVIAAGSIGWVHRAALLLRVPRLSAMWRLHPRAYSVATAAVAWGLVFSGYSIVTQPTTSQPVLASQNLGNGQQQNGSTPNGTSTQPGASQAPGAPGATQAPGVTGPNGSVPGGTTPGSTGTNGQLPGPVSSSAPSSQGEFTGAGSWKTINGVQVFFPATGGAPVAQLYSGSDDTIGITANQIEICAHAALTYGSAFNISANDLNVYWDWLNDHGGIFGRSVHGDYVNDNYDPGTAVQAAQKCKDMNTFFLLGGIGFDQIPAVRQWAEQNHELYYHHIATIEGSQGLRYSFSPLPTVEQMGTYFGQLAVQKYRGQKVGVLYRDSSNWTPGSDAFARVVKAAGMQVISYGVTINQGNYTQELTQLNAAGVKVVFAWENALATTEMIKQAQGQDYHPAWLVFPFNIETQTLGASSLDQPLLGVAAWDAYDPNYYGGLFGQYASDIHEFEREYKTYDPSAKLSGDGGDLLFLNWEAQRQVADMLEVCGKNCTRNRLAGILLAGYHRTVSPNCDINFGATSDHHHGGSLVNVLEVVKDPNGRANFVPIQRCVSSIGG